MRYPERIGRRGSRPFHTAIATTFAVEFSAFEEIMLPQILASGATNTILVADGRMAAMSLSDGTLLPRQLGRDYEMVTTPASLGLFHPKILLQLGRKSGRLFVGSANVTASGISGNAEAIYEIECTDEPGPEQAIVRAAWLYLSDLLVNERGAARDGLEWAAARTPWLTGAAAEDVQELVDGTLTGFFAGFDGAAGIAQRFVGAVGADTVDQLVVVSPYWDNNLAALSDLDRQLAPKRVSVLIDPDTHQFPLDSPRPASVAFRNLPAKFKGRFTHAKIFVASTAKYDHVLMGSANCTMAALSDRPLDRNGEASIYRRVPRGQGLEAFELMPCLAEPPMDPSQINPREVKPDIPLAALSRSKAGTFETEGTVLTWIPARDFAAGGAVILKDFSDRELEVIPFGGAEARHARSFRLTSDFAADIAFAVVTEDEFVSSPSHVSHRSVLRGRRRETATGATARAIDAFSGADDFDLWVHQSFDQLARADLEDSLERAGVAAARPGQTRADKAETEYKSLTYDEFMNSRTPDVRGIGRQDSTLTGSYSDSVRAFLNRLIGIVPSASEEDWLNDSDEDGAIDDIANDAEKTPVAPKKSDDLEKKSPPVDVKKITSAVNTYITAMTSDERPTGSSEVLRLRLWMMMLLHKARHAGDDRLLETVGTEGGWPRMAMRIISAFFMGNNAPVSRLMVAREYLEMPPDFLETWVTVVRLLDIVDGALVDDPREAQIVARARQLRAVVIKTIGLTQLEIESSVAVNVTDGIDRTLRTRIERYAREKRRNPSVTKVGAIRRRILS